MTAHAQEIKDRTNVMIQRELDRCRSLIGEREWGRHREWITQNVVTAAKIYLDREASEGRL